MSSSKTPTKRSVSKQSPNSEAKQQKTADSDDLDDLFADTQVSAPVIVSSKMATNGAVDDTTLDSTLEVPEGYSLAYNPGQTNTIKALVTGASAKYNQIGPTSVKLTCKALNIKNAGADITRAGPMMAIALSKNDKVKDASGTYSSGTVCVLR